MVFATLWPRAARCRPVLSSPPDCFKSQGPDEAKFMLNRLRKSAARKEFAIRLESQMAARARDPFFFRVLNVPDTVDGRFDLVALHGWLVLERLKEARMDEAAQAFTDYLFVGFDEAL